MADITMPQLGETVTEGTITRWFKAIGDTIAEDEVLFEVSTDKVDSEVPSPVSGVLSEILVAEGDTVDVGVILARVGGDAAPAAPAPAPEAAAAPVAAVAPVAAPEPAPVAAAPVAAAPAPAAAAGPGADITMPQLGESVTEGTITRWFKAVGDTVAEDEVLFEVSTDKVDSEVPSPVAGVLGEILVPEGDTVDVGVVLARMSGAGAAPAAAPAAPAAPAPAAAAPAPVAAAPAPAAVVAAAPVSSAVGKLLSPVVRRLVSENNIDVDQLTGTGVGGRITRGDVEKAISEGRGQAAAAPAPVAAAPAPAAAAAAPAAPAPAAPAPAAAGDGSGGGIEKFSNIRRLTGEHMVMSKSTAPHVLTAIEVDYEGVDMVRKANKAAFKAEEGVSLTYLPFIARALTDALREFPNLNASVVDGGLLPHDDVNLAIAVDLDFQGLLTPVVQNADAKRLRAIATEIADLATRARSKKLSADEISGGTFTITNAGGYGTMMQFPVISQPQVAILSTDGISRKPVVVTDAYGNESIAIHSVGVLALAWDHRAFDGAYAAAFLARIREIIETRDWSTEI